MNTTKSVSSVSTPCVVLKNREKPSLSSLNLKISRVVCALFLILAGLQTVVSLEQESANNREVVSCQAPSSSPYCLFSRPGMVYTSPDAGYRLNDFSELALYSYKQAEAVHLKKNLPQDVQNVVDSLESLDQEAVQVSPSSVLLGLHPRSVPRCEEAYQLAQRLYDEMANAPPQVVVESMHAIQTALGGNGQFRSDDVMVPSQCDQMGSLQSTIEHVRGLGNQKAVAALEELSEQARIAEERGVPFTNDMISAETQKILGEIGVLAPPSAMGLRREMIDWIRRVQIGLQEGKKDPKKLYVLAAQLIQSAGQIRFYDRLNGRWARLLAAVILQQNGLAPILFTNETEYRQAIQDGEAWLRYVRASGSDTCRFLDRISQTGVLYKSFK